MTSVEVFWGGEPEHQSEREFLAQLRAELEGQQHGALILANFYLSGGLQVDFLIITPDRLCHIELKHYDEPLVGDKNGPWKVRQADGSLREVERQNPYAQATRQRFALSDDLRRFAETEAAGIPAPPRKEFYRWFDSVVCIFPALAEGSSVPGDFKVKTLDYTDMVRLLTSSTQRFPWDRTRWLRFIQHLGLMNADAATRPTPAASDAELIIRDYRQAFADFYGRDLHELVSTPIVVDGQATTPEPDVPSLLHGAASVQLLGESGSGKSHLATHTILAGLDSWVPIFARAVMYEGRLSGLLDRSVAPLAVLTAQQLFGAARHANSPVVVVLDGFNECPTTLQPQLVSDLAALALRAPFVLLLTSQTPVPLPPRIEAVTVRTGTLGPAERQAVLTSYGASEIMDLSEPFQTAYELSLAAQCAAELRPPVTRSQLFDAFVRHSLAGLTSPASTRAALRQAALAMDEQLTGMLPVDEVWRLAERDLIRQPTPRVVIDDLFHCRLVRLQQGSFSFSHELIGRFLTAEALLLGSDAQQLVGQLKKPRHADLIELLIPLETQPDALRELLASLADSSVLLRSLDAQLGMLAKQVVQREARRILAEVAHFMDEVLLTFETAGPFSKFGYDRHGPSTYELAVLAAVGRVLPHWVFLAEALELLDATDRALERAREVGAADGTNPVPRSTLGSAISGMVTGPGVRLPASVMLYACEHAGFGKHYGRHVDSPTPTERIGTILAGAQDRSYSRLYLLCLLVQSAEPPTVVQFVADLLDKCWRSGTYHVRLAALHMTQMFSLVAEGETRDAIVAVLDDLRPSNIFLSSTVVEALHSYGLVQSPYSVEGVLAQIRSVLSEPESEDAQQAAYSIAVSQFEDVIAEPYVEAVESLSRQDRLRLTVLAALGAADAHGFFSDWILKRLVDARDPQALPAFERWLQYPDSQSPGPQDDTACFALAMQGWALLEQGVPVLDTPANEDEAAWQCYGEIIYWLRRADLTLTEVHEYCAPIWDRLAQELALAAVDPLYRLAHAFSLRHDEEMDSHRRIVATFPDEVRRLLEDCLSRHDQLTSIFRHKEGLELAQYMLDALGCVGNDSTRELLTAYVDDEELGRTAISSLRRLGQAEGRRM